MLVFLLISRDIDKKTILLNFSSSMNVTIQVQKDDVPETEARMVPLESFFGVFKRPKGSNFLRPPRIVLVKS